MKISGHRSASHWKERTASLVLGQNAEAWGQVFDDFFVERLKTRYFDPVQQIANLEKDAGEGFAIVAIQCSLIEFLGAIRTGQTYIHPSELNGRKKRDDEYTSSKAMFVKFLTKNLPFSTVFTREADAEDFYKGVRCALLHEARTSKGWRIHSEDAKQRFVDLEAKIVYRDDLQNAFQNYVQRYRTELLASSDLQKCFLAKFEALCVP